MIRWMRTARIGRDDEGVALVMVLGMSSVLCLLVGAAVTYAVNSQQQARGTQDFNAALSAAYAGIEEYQSRLANTSAYFQYGNPAAPFTVDTGSADMVDLPAETNPAFGVGETGTWAEVDGSGGAAEFRYEVDTSTYFSEGTLRLRSTGRASGETRSIVADLRQKGFIEFLYFTDYEIQDPLISGADPSCELHRYAGRSSSCSNINFISADTINGPLHSNDAFQVCGSPQFLGKTTSSYQPDPGDKRYHVGGSCGDDPNFAANLDDDDADYLPVLGMPETTAELKIETHQGNDLVPTPGCMFTGPTLITFTADGKMRVKSPWTKFTAGNTNANNTGCGTPGTSGLAGVNGQLLDVMANNVVFVQNVPTVAGDANYWAPAEAGTPTCLLMDRTTSGGRNDNGNPVGFPAANEYVPNASVYGCKNGDAFVQGTVDGRTTVATENYIYVTGNVVYESMDDDMLGMIGQNAVMVYKPQTQSSTRATDNNLNTSTKNSRLAAGWACVLDGSSWDCERYTFSAANGDLVTNTNRRIDSAILSVAHTFQVQNYNRGGNRGTLTVNGAIAQKFRGTVGTGSGGSVTTGYAKNYQYDPRFQYTGPPKYLSPATTTYGVTVWVEVSPAFDKLGRTR